MGERGGATSAAPAGLAWNSTYYWQVRATNAAGTTDADGAATAFASFTTLAVPGAFLKVAPVGATGLPTTVTLSWATSTGAAFYEYCVDTTNDNACASWLNVGPSLSATLTGLAAGTTYYWHVRAVNAAGTAYSGGPSTLFRPFSTAASPGAFVKTGPANGVASGTTSPLLTWSVSSGTSTYEYCVDTTNDNACATWVSTGASTSVAVSGLSTGTIYYWQVRAINPGGTTYADGASAAFVSFTP